MSGPANWDPFSLIINANLVRSLYWGRRYDDAIIHARKTLQMDPKFGVTLFWLEGSLRHKGMFSCGKATFLRHKGMFLFDEGSFFRQERTFLRRK